MDLLCVRASDASAYSSRKGSGAVVTPIEVRRERSRSASIVCPAKPQQYARPRRDFVLVDTSPPPPPPRPQHTPLATPRPRPPPLQRHPRRPRPHTQPTSILSPQTLFHELQVHTSALRSSRSDDWQPSPCDHFHPTPVFCGKREGFYFGDGSFGVGYYRDPRVLHLSLARGTSPPTCRCQTPPESTPVTPPPACQIVDDPTPDTPNKCFTPTGVQMKDDDPFQGSWTQLTAIDDETRRKRRQSLAKRKRRASTRVGEDLFVVNRLLLGRGHSADTSHLPQPSPTAIQDGHDSGDVTFGRMGHFGTPSNYTFESPVRLAAPVALDLHDGPAFNTPSSVSLPTHNENSPEGRESVHMSESNCGSQGQRHSLGRIRQRHPSPRAFVGPDRSALRTPSLTVANMEEPGSTSSTLVGGGAGAPSHPWAMGLVVCMLPSGENNASLFMWSILRQRHEEYLLSLRMQQLELEASEKGDDCGAGHHVRVSFIEGDTMEVARGPDTSSPTSSTLGPFGGTREEEGEEEGEREGGKGGLVHLVKPPEGTPRGTAHKMRLRQLRRLANSGAVLPKEVKVRKQVTPSRRSLKKWWSRMGNQEEEEKCLPKLEVKEVKLGQC